ncbi:MAG: hypothetical protein NT027_05850 [Proteobacteria bacterium]|nr:hypothetical protein [Pseudomonadota bacterium]
MNLKNHFWLLRTVLMILILCPGLSRAQDGESANDGNDEVEDVTLDGALGGASSSKSEPVGEAESAPTPVVNPTTSQSSTSTSESAEVDEQEEDSSDQEDTAESDQEEQENEEKTDVVEQAPSTETPAQEIAQSEEADDVDLVKSGYKQRMFGSKKIQLGLNKPTFTEKGTLLEKLYGKPREYFSFGVDWFPFDGWVSPGISGKIGGFSWTGKAAKAADRSQPISESNLTVDENSKAVLLFVPLQLAAKVQMTPFKKKWLIFDAWFGYEYGWWQETRPEDSDSASGATTAALLADAETEQKPVLTSKGVNNALIFGGSAHILISWLDEKSSRSMRETMGLSSIYLTPFFESVKSTKTGGYTFGRNLFGLGFTFESVY